MIQKTSVEGALRGSPYPNRKGGTCQPLILRRCALPALNSQLHSPLLCSDVPHGALGALETPFYGTDRRRSPSRDKRVAHTTRSLKSDGPAWLRDRPAQPALRGALH